MSATPPALPSSKAAPNGKPVLQRKPVGVDPLVQRKMPPKYRPPIAKKPAQPGNSLPIPKTASSSRPASARPSPQPAPNSHQSLVSKDDVGGFSDPTATSYQDFKVVTTKRALLEGLRHHVLSLTSNQNFDIQNEEEFTRPVRLHRRDPKVQPPAPVKDEAEEPPPNEMDRVEREAYLKRKEERQKEREANLAQIAPSVDTGKKLKNFTKKTEQVFRPGHSTDQRKKARDKYEEKLPWHLEDFNEKHCLVGSYQPTMSHLYAALVLEADPTGQAAGRCRILPIEKWYKFGPKTVFHALTIEEAEKQMKRTGKDPAWLEKHRELQMREDQIERVARESKGLFTAPRTDGAYAGGRAEDGGADLDFEDDFADDEEGNLFEEKDEDQKLAEQRIKQEQLSANFFDNKDEREVDFQEKVEQIMKNNQGKYGRKLNKALRRREGNFNLGSDTEEDMFGSDSSETDSEAERAKKAEEEAKAKDEKGNQSGAEGKSGTSSKGTNTPSGRKEKHGTGSDRDIAARKAASLKRPGSPNLSDAGSGTDASTRRIKHKHLKPSAGASGMRVGDASQSKKRKSLAPGVGAGSDSEGPRGALSDGAGSDSGSQMKRLKLNPPGSASAQSVTPQNGSRASSPQATSPPAGSGLPSAAEVIAAIPPYGIGAMVLYKMFKNRIADDQRSGFWNLIKQVGKINKDTKMVMPKAPKEAAGQTPPATAA